MQKNKNKTFSALIYGFRKAFSLLPSKKDRFMVLWLWIAYLVSYGITMIQPLLQMWIVDGAVSLITEDVRYYLLTVSLVVMVFTYVVGFLYQKKHECLSANASFIIETVYRRVDEKKFKKSNINILKKNNI